MSSLGLRLVHTYQQLPSLFYTHQMPTSVVKPELVIFNESLANDLGLHPSNSTPEQLAQWFSGSTPLPNAQPIAQAYAGHQFGHFNRLGDGRAILLGEHQSPRLGLVDIQLKGSGPTPYSRRGDGRAALGPMLREYLISEAMHALGIPTTRSLAVVRTGERIIRETMLPGAVLTRIASSHIRVGTFEYAAAFSTLEEAKKLLTYTIQRHPPQHSPHQAPELQLLASVMDKQMTLITHWMRVGFIHGVMNTDNMSIAGETIDYGPCAFMDEYHPDTVFSSIDRLGRYAYFQQPSIAHWNLTQFAETLPFAKQALEEILQSFAPKMKESWLKMMSSKLGLTKTYPEDSTLISDLLNWMQTHEADYTNTFLVLGNQLSTANPIYQTLAWQDWKQRWYARLQQEGSTESAASNRMRQVNPAVIPRNHLVDKALREAEQGNLQFFLELLEVLKNPYSKPLSILFQTPPTAKEAIQATFCGT